MGDRLPATGLTREGRLEWVRRGFKDPRKSYLQHAKSAGQRGIEFKLTFAEWWSYWEPHYHERGQATDQKCMCRTGDKGAYEVGNVRIDTVRANISERTAIFRLKGRTKVPARVAVIPVQADWLWRRRVFDPYEEPEYDQEC